MSTTAKPLPGTLVDPLYPASDGKPMGETGVHVRTILGLYALLRDHVAEDTYVAADMFLYYERGNPAACKAPDIMVIKGVGNHERRSFRLWEEKAGPRVVFEFPSEDTVEEDLGPKMDVYAKLRIPEYFLYDPDGTWMQPALRGYRLVRGRFRRIEPAADGSLLSEELGMRILAEGERVRLFDAVTGKPLLPAAEEARERAQRRARKEQKKAEQERQRAEQERQRAEQERQRAEQEQQRAEQEQQRADEEQQRAEQERRRAEEGQQRADEERRRAEQERQRAEAATMRAQALEQELARLRERLKGQ